MKNPWLGLQSYSEESLQEYQFNGRAAASASVASLIRNNLFVTLYGRSGIGKTSLLQAGVFPLLRCDGFIPVMIRLNHIEDRVKESRDNESIKNEHQKGDAARYIWEEINSNLGKLGFSYIPCDEKDTCEPDFSDVLVFRKLFSAGRFINDNGEEGIPVMVLDQFEEILYKAPRAAFLLVSQLYALIDDNYNLEISHPNWHDDTNFRIVASIREDDLYLFEDCIDTLNCVDFKSNRFRLMPLTETQAREVVQNPVRDKCIFEDGKEEKIVDEIINISKNNGPNVNTHLLSLLCYALYNNLQVPGDRITMEDLGNYKDILETYYLEVVKGLPKEERYYIEDHLVDEQGRRTSVYKSDIEKFAPKVLHLIKNSKDSDASKNSNESKILFIENQGRIELIHDQLASSLRVFRNKRVDERRSRFVAVSLICYFIFASFIIWGILLDILNLSWNVRPKALPNNQILAVTGNEAILLGSQIFSYIIIIFLLGFEVPKTICQYFYGAIKIRKLIPLILGLIISILMASNWLFEMSLTINSIILPIIGYMVLILLLIYSILILKKQNNSNETK